MKRELEEMHKNKTRMKNNKILLQSKQNLNHRHFNLLFYNINKFNTKNNLISSNIQ